MTNAPVTFPSLAENQSPPVWTGACFELGGEKLKVLSYHATKSGWSDDLTQMHEDSSGDNHYIDVASRQNAINELTAVLIQEEPVLLEVGCSSGFFLEALQKKAPHADLVGSDFISGPLHKLADRLHGVPILQFDITKCPLEDARFDAVVLLNVLEHIENDFEAIKQVYRILKPGGLAFIEVPAGPNLYDFYDKHLMHCRRYRLKDLKALAERANFKVLKASHLGFFLYPLFALVKKINRLKGSQMTEADRQEIVTRQIKGGSTHWLMHALMKLELALAKYVSYPIGIRCTLTLKK